MIGDLRRNVITTYTADTADFVAGSKKMQTAVKETAKAEDEAGKAREKHGQGAVDWLGKMGAAYLGFSKLASDAMKLATDSTERMRMATAAGSINIDKLSAASAGLFSTMQLTTLAAQTQHGAFKLTEAQMITVAKAARELTREGFAQDEVMKKLTETFVKSEAEGLKDFGIRIDSTKTKTEQMTEAMSQLKMKADIVGDSAANASEEFTGSTVKMSDAIDKIKDSLGRLVIQLGPLVSLIADAVDLIAKLPKTDQRQLVPEFTKGLTLPSLEERDKARGIKRKPEDAWATHESVLDLGVIPKKGDKAIDDGSRSRLDAEIKALTDALVEDLSNSISSVSDQIGSKAAGGAGYAGALPSGGYTIEDVKSLTEAYGKTDAPSFLEGVFGSLDEFDTYRGAFEALGGAVGASLGALIDGSGSAASAFKHFIADTMKSLAISNAIKAITETAEGFASLASGSPASATLHFTAAAKHGLAAVAAGGAAAVLGTTAGDANAARASGGSAGGSRGSSGGSTGGGDDHRPIVIVTGNDQADQTPRMRQVNAQRYVELAIGRAGYGTSDR